MRPFTRYKKIDNEHIEETDELTDETKIITVDELSKELEKHLYDYYSENYEKLIGNLNNSQNKLSFLFINYTDIINQLIRDYDVGNFFLKSGCIWCKELKIETEEGKHITVYYDSPHDDILKYKDDIERVLFKTFIDKKIKADNIFLEITSKIDREGPATKDYINKQFDKLYEIIKPEQRQSPVQKPPTIIKDLIDQEKLRKTPIDGKYKPNCNMKDFIEWCFNNGYQDIDESIIEKWVNHDGVKMASINKYISECKTFEKKENTPKKPK
jgi:hypothetical protein